MMELDITNDELEALRNYKSINYESINQLLVSNAETDLVLLSDEAKNKFVSLSYDKNSVIKNIETIKKLYELMQKKYYKTEKKEGWVFSRGTNIAEIERLKNEVYVDKFLSTTQNKSKAENEFSAIWNKPAVMYICGTSNIPYISVDEILGKQNDSQEIIIAPFTKIINIKEIGEQEIENNSKKICMYNVTIEKQELEQLTLAERNGLYNYIIENADSINRKLRECIDLERENIINYENIRKLEQLLAKYEQNAEIKEIGKDYSDLERKADYDDVQRINKELEQIKENASHLFEIKKQNLEFVTNWKKNIAVYMMAECKEIELIYKSKNIIYEEKNEEKLIKYKEEAKEEFEKNENEKLQELTTQVKKECDENIETSEKLLENIKKLITKEQNHAKIANSLECSYSALNNGFEMKKVAETVNELLIKIKDKVENLCEEEDRTLLIDKLSTISKINLQIGTLFNYLNNPKISLANTNITRFDEMAIIEENELKRKIAETIRNIRGEAELKKLKDDIEIIDEKGAFSKFFGIFTGQNKLDEFKLDQIELRQYSIRKTLARRLSLAYNYSIHELVADIRMFIEDNEDDYLVKNDIKSLKKLEEELKRNFVVLDSKVQEIINRKEGGNLPIEKNRRISKKENIEMQTQKFLRKYGYTLNDNNEIEPAYQDTMANEIARIVEYINSSNVLRL